MVTCTPESAQKQLEFRIQEKSVDRVTGNTLQAVPVQSVFVLQMADAGLDGGAAFHPAPQRPRRAAPSSLVHMHGNLALVVVTAIAHVHMRLADPLADHVPDLLHLRRQRVTIIGIAGKAFCTDQPSAPTGGSHTDLVAELIRLARLALGDAGHLGLMHAVHLVLLMPLLRVDRKRGKVPSGCRVVDRLMMSA